MQSNRSAGIPARVFYFLFALNLFAYAGRDARAPKLFYTNKQKFDITFFGGRDYERR